MVIGFRADDYRGREGHDWSSRSSVPQNLTVLSVNWRVLGIKTMRIIALIAADTGDDLSAESFDGDTNDGRDN